MGSEVGSGSAEDGVLGSDDGRLGEGLSSAGGRVTEMVTRSGVVVVVSVDIDGVVFCRFADVDGSSSQKAINAIAASSSSAAMVASTLWPVLQLSSATGAAGRRCGAVGGRLTGAEVAAVETRVGGR
ncbi:hypothetical protein, partial [Gordonia hirsuta]|uniref:hypothetical protein n=1 Tax=Gordonia hirsuta TaxID=53427 RepID=UPI0012DFAEF8